MTAGETRNKGAPVGDVQHLAGEHVFGARDVAAAQPGARLRLGPLEAAGGARVHVLLPARGSMRENKGSKRVNELEKYFISGRRSARPRTARCKRVNEERKLIN